MKRTDWARLVQGTLASAVFFGFLVVANQPYPNICQACIDGTRPLWWCVLEGCWLWML